MEKDPMSGSKSPEEINRSIEKAKAEWEAAFDSISEGLAIIDTDGRIKRVNRAMAELLGRDVRIMVGLNCCEVFPHHKVHPDGCPVKNYPSGRTGSFEVFFPEYRFYEERVSPSPRQGKPHGYVIAVREVTRERLAEQERKNLHLQLEEGTRKRKQIEEMIDTLRRDLASAEKIASLGRLTATILAEIHRMVRMLEDGLRILLAHTEASSVGGEVASVLSDLAQAATKSRRILERLGELRLNVLDRDVPVDLNELIRELIAELSATFGDTVSKVELKLTDLPKVLGNRALLKIAFSSVIMNALEAISRGGGKVVLSTRSERGMAITSVEDTGTGIKPFHLSEVFAPFFTTADQGSKVGLGLTVCLAVVQGHGGQVEIASQPDVGTKVRVSLPGIRE